MEYTEKGKNAYLLNKLSKNIKNEMIKFLWLFIKKKNLIYKYLKIKFISKIFNYCSTYLKIH